MLPSPQETVLGPSFVPWALVLWAEALSASLMTYKLHPHMATRCQLTGLGPTVSNSLGLTQSLWVSLSAFGLRYDQMVALASPRGEQGGQLPPPNRPST